MKKHPWAYIYSIFLLSLGIYILLDAFVIPRSYAQVATTTTSAATSTLDSTSSSESAGEDATSISAGSNSQGAMSSGSSSGASNDSGTTQQENTSTDSSQQESSANSTTSEAVVTATSYQDDNISISYETIRVANTDVYVVDVQLSSVEYLKTAFAKNTYGRNVKDTTSNIASQVGAILAINGDFYGWRDSGYVLRNGIIYRDSADSSVNALVIGQDGTMYAASEASTTAQELLDSGAWQVESFGPVLVENGQVVVSTNAEVGQAMRSNPRTAIGMISPLHYVIVVSDGRTSQSEGLSLYELAGVFANYGCSFAYNLDGGGSTTLWFMGEVINNPTSGHSSGEREVSDIVYIGY